MSGSFLDWKILDAKETLMLLIPQFPLILSYTIGMDMDKDMSDEILTLKEVAGYLKLAEKTAYRLAAEGRLPGFKVGGSWRFRESDIQSWIEESKKSKKSKKG